MALFSPWRDKDRVLLMERLELYISAGLALDKALSLVEEGSPRKHKPSLVAVRGDVLAGSLFSRSLARHIGFSQSLSGLVEHGESSGELLRAIQTARSVLEKQGEMRKKCFSALVYPGVIGIFAALLTIGLVRGVMPQIIPMLKSLNVPLPLLTRIVIFISENSMLYGVYILAGAAGLFIIGMFLYRYLGFFKYYTHLFFLHLPIIGSIIFSYGLSQFLRSLGSLVESGLSITTSYRNTASTVSILPFKKQLESKRGDIDRGFPCGSTLKAVSRRIPLYVPSLLSAGEASGTLGASLIRAATIIDRDLDHNLKRLTSLIEPVMMAGMGCVVGSIALSIMMPIYDISKVLQQ